MEKETLKIKKLSIHKLPGFPRGMAPFSDLADNVNIFAGPNASGKSSTARMIKDLIWRHPAPGRHAECSARTGADKWDIEIDSNSVKIQRNGLDDDMQGLPNPETSSRYMLALQDLVREEEEGLARQIAKESLGGYDLDEAIEQLGYSDKIKNKTTKEYKNFAETEKDYKDVLEKQKKLKHDEEKLTTLYAEQQEAEKASKLKELYEKTLAYMQAAEKLESSGEKHKKFPDILREMSGKEYETVTELEEVIESCSQDIQKAKETQKQSRLTISELNLPENGIGNEVLKELDRKVEKIENLQKEIDEKKKKIIECETKAQHSLDNIDEELDIADWDGITLDEITKLDEFLQDAHQAFSEESFLTSAIEELKSVLQDENEKGPDADGLNAGILALNGWLTAQKRAEGVKMHWVMVIAAIGALISIISSFIGVLGLLGLPLIVIGVILAVKSESAADEKKVREQDYQKTGLNPPERWDADAVMQCLESLLEDLEAAKWDQKTRQELKNFHKELQEVNTRINTINDQHAQWVEKLGAVPDLPSEKLKNYNGLYWFLHHVKEWYKNETEKHSLQKQKEKLNRTCSKNFGRINTLFQAYNAGNAEDVIQAKGIYEKLREEEEIRRSKAAEILNQEKWISEKEKDKKRYTEKMAGIYKKLRINQGAKNEILQLTELIKDYKKAENEWELARRKLSEQERAMKNHSLYSHYKNELKALTPDQTEEKITEFREKADQLPEINRQITAIETTIDNTKKANDLENALARKEEKLDDLEELYDNNLASITGNLIVNQLKNDTQQKRRPKILEHSSRLFNRITQGRYELKLAEGNDPAFHAYDTILGRGQNLEELSTGTRIQLLLSVRLGYIETQEKSIKLPLLADELLANSDDLRAKAIIDALMEISKDGRQVFYFTAQADEVARWKRYLDSGSDISYKLIELSGKEADDSAYKNLPAEFAPLELIYNIPSPEGKDYEDYGRLLEVPTFNMLADTPDNIHLWYLLDDVDTLYQLLRKGIRCWGQLNSFLRNKGKIESLDKETEHEIEAKVKFLDRFQKLYKTGRSKPIDREVIEKSGAVSDKFIEEVCEKLRELNGDPEKLLQSLEAGEVSRFYQNKINELEEFLSENDYIDDRPALEEGEIIAELHAFLSTNDLSAETAEDLIRKVL